MPELSEQVSYRINKFSANVQTEVKRLQAQVELFWGKEVRIYQDFGLTDGMKVLECGCGPGYLIEKIIGHFPRCRVVGLESDPYLVETAKKNFQDKGIDVEDVVRQSIMDIEFPDNSFDFVVTRLVLEHLPDPAAAVKEVHRVLRPEGKAVFIDNDFDIHLKTFPDIPELAELYDAYCRARIDEGGNPRIGRQLPGILQQNNFANVNIETIVAHSQVIGDQIFMQSEGSGIPSKLVEDGYLPREVFDRIAYKWVEMLQEEDHVIFRQLFVAGGEKIAGYLNKNSMATALADGTGKQGKLPAEDAAKLQTEESPVRPPAKNCEEQMRDIWREILDLETVGLHDNFFDLGGNSLLAVQIVQRIKKIIGAPVSVTELFQYPTVNALAQSLTQDADTQSPAGTAAERARTRREAIMKRRQQAQKKKTE